MKHKITYRKGKIVHLGEKPFILDLIHRKFEKRKFVKSELREFLDRDLGIKSISRHLDTLKNGGWLNSKKIGKGTSKDSRNYYLSKRAKDYLDRWGSFHNGPFGKRKEPDVKIVEKEVEKETKETKQEDVVGFV